MSTEAKQKTRLEQSINYMIFCIMFGVVIFLDANLFWKVGLETMLTMGVVLMVVFTVGHISRTFIRPILIFSLLSVVATTLSIVIMGDVLIDRHDSNNGNTQVLESELADKEVELSELKENGNYSEATVGINTEITSIKNRTGWTNSLGDSVRGSLWSLTNECRGGTGNSNWYLGNRKAMKQGCSDIESLQQTLLQSSGQSIRELRTEITELRRKVQEAKDSSKGVGSSIVERGNGLAEIINQELLADTGFKVDFSKLIALMAFLVAVLVEYLFQKHSPARFKPVSKDVPMKTILKRSSRHLVVWLWRKRKNARTQKATAQENQSVTINSKPTQNELKINSEPTQLKPEPVSVPFQASSEDVCRELVNVRPETLGDYLETLPELTEGESLVLSYLMIFYGENPAAERVLANAKASDLIKERENTAPGWAKAIFSGTGVNHKYVGKAKEILADNGYLLKEVKTGKRTLTFYDWKSPAKVAAIIRNRQNSTTQDMSNVVALKRAAR